MSIYNENINMAFEWIVNSGIHFKDSKNNFDAFYESYNKNKKNYSFIYCEITGYAINFLLNFYKRKKEKNILEIAKRAGDFLVFSQGKEGNIKGAIPWTVNERGKSHHLYYSFDTSMCLSGLVDLYLITKEKKYLKSAIMAADWIISKAQDKDGSFKALYNTRQNSFYNDSSEKIWSGNNGCLHIKHIIGLLKIYEITNHKKYLKSMNKLLGWSRKMQNRDGSFKAIRDENFIFTHAHCYATEGIIFAYKYFKDEKYIKSILDSAAWLLKVQNKDGSFFDYYELPNIPMRFIRTKNIIKKMYHGTIKGESNAIIKIKRTDATAQAARIMLFAHLLNHNMKYKKAAKKAVTFLQKMQSNSKNKNERGAVCFSLLDLIGLKRKSILYNSWSSMFAANAMYYMNRINNKENMGISNFIDNLF